MVMFSENYYVYIMTNQRDTVFYTGITSNLVNRVWKHKNKIYKGFTAKYNIDKLIYYERYYLVEEAIDREKKIKKLSRINKLKLIRKENLDLKDLSKDWY